MAGLQRSATTFRRSGSSGLVWDERFFSGDLNQIKKKEAAEAEKFGELRHSKSVGSPAAAAAAGAMASGYRAGAYGGRRHGFRAGEVSPAADPPSPRASHCVCCGVFGKPSSAAGGAAARRPKPRRR